MSVLSYRNFHTPMSQANIEKLLGCIAAVKSHQEPMSTATQYFTADHDGTVRSLYAVLEASLGAAETLSVNVTVNGTSIMTGAVAQVLTTTTSADAQVELDWIAGSTIATGDLIAIIRTHANSDVAPSTVIGLEWS